MLTTGYLVVSLCLQLVIWLLFCVYNWLSGCYFVFTTIQLISNLVICVLTAGNLGVNLDNSSVLTWEDVADGNPAVQAGGTWAPTDCVARHRVAIIIPYRDREQHLITLLYYLHPTLQRQQLDYRIYVVEQVRFMIQTCPH